ncbi:putative diheme cytochrome c-553 [Candidatus Nasuia deltocephalinicola]|nr:putative diheme cytochrome c-553 [Candidatus Nasuia deltocephalinicola]
MIINLILLNNINKKNIKKIFSKNKNFNKKGKYLSKIANCISCHTPIGAKPFSGGVPIKTKFGTIFTPNITPNEKEGIGNINLEKFKKIITKGISEKNEFLYPIFPYNNYSKLKNSDINSIFIFIKSIPKENIKNIENKINFPLKYKKLLFAWRIFFLKKVDKKYLKLTSSLKRGKYLTNHLGHCNMCHSKTNNFEGNIKKLNYSGNIISESKWYAPPLINNSKHGIKNKNIQELSNILSWGKTKNKTILGPMSEIINNSLQNISKIDIKSISSFLKILFNNNYKEIKNINIKKINKFNSKFFYKKGKIIYKNMCLECHGKLSLGNFPNYSNLNKNIINNNFKQNIYNILSKTNNNNSLKNKFSSIMENFINSIKNKDYWYIINYILYINKLKK